MPELPDLQVFRKNIEKKFAGKKLTQVEVFNEYKVDTPAKKLKSELEGKKLDSVLRDGKELFFNFQGGNTLGIHLMLNGELHFFIEANHYKNKIIEFLFDDNHGLLLTDRQQYANVKLNPPKPDAPDALADEFTLEYLQGKIKKVRSKKIKDLLMDQKVVRGIGNAYVDEILWDAKIHPASNAAKIPDAKIEELYKSIQDVLINAEEEIIKRNPDIITGEIRDFLKVHNHKVQHSPTGGLIKKEDLSKRITYYTDEQELFE